MSFILNAFDLIGGLRKGPSPKVRDITKKYKDWKIIDYSICRIPLTSKIEAVLNLVTLGHIHEDLKERDYDNLYHLFMLVKIISPDGSKTKRILLEKNEIVEVTEKIPSLKTSKCIPVEGPSISIGELLLNGEDFQGKNKFWLYDARNNNCQVFIMSLVNGNKLRCTDCGTMDDLRNFVKQDVEDLLVKPLWSLAKGLTNTAHAFNIILYGASF